MSAVATVSLIACLHPRDSDDENSDGGQEIKSSRDRNAGKSVFCELSTLKQQGSLRGPKRTAVL